MKLLLIHGAPASGKLTTSKALLDRVRGRLFDNHAAIEIARTVFNFGTSELWELVQATRVLVLESASRQSLPLLVMTFVYVDPIHLKTFEQFESVVQHGGGQVLPVFLECSLDALVKRVSNRDRVIRNKMVSEGGIRDFMNQNNVAPIPRPNCLMLDSDARSAEENAEEIIRYYDLSQDR